jgi:hypothetical protein
MRQTRLQHCVLHGVPRAEEHYTESISLVPIENVGAAFAWYVRFRFQRFQNLLARGGKTQKKDQTGRLLSHGLI